VEKQTDRQTQSIKPTQSAWVINIKQGVTLTGRNYTGPPCNHGGGRPPMRPADTVSAHRQRYRRQRTPSSKTILAH